MWTNIFGVIIALAVVAGSRTLTRAISIRAISKVPRDGDYRPLFLVAGMLAFFAVVTMTSILGMLFGEQISLWSLAGGLVGYLWGFLSLSPEDIQTYLKRGTPCSSPA